MWLNVFATYVLPAISLISLIVAAFWFIRLRRLETEKKKAVTQVESFETIDPTNEAPYDKRKSVKVALESISERFNLLRRFIIPLFVIFSLLLGSIPFLDGFGQSYVSVLVGAITVILGFAARPFIENVIAGLLISVGKSVRAGDTVQLDENYGTIEEITLTYTVLKIWDWRRYIVPNSEFIKKAFINYNYRDDFIWARVVFSVSMDSDIEKVQQIAIDSMKRSAALSDFGDPVFWCMGMENNRIDCWVTGWASSPNDHWNLAHDTRMEMIKAFKREKIKGHLNHLSLHESEDLGRNRQSSL